MTSREEHRASLQVRNSEMTRDWEPTVIPFSGVSILDAAGELFAEKDAGLSLSRI
jgi:hypothetical protein